MFYNEIFEETKLLRTPNESGFRRDWRALCQLAIWYDTHLKHEKKIILLSELPHDDVPENITVMTMKQYLDTYYEDNKLLQNLVQVLAEVVLEDNEEEQSKIKITSKHNGATAGNDAAVSGYTEVKKCLLLYMEIIIWSLFIRFIHSSINLPKNLKSVSNLLVISLVYYDVEKIAEIKLM
jgi:hypothetical protein